MHTFERSMFTFNNTVEVAFDDQAYNPEMSESLEKCWYSHILMIFK